MIMSTVYPSPMLACAIAGMMIARSEGPMGAALRFLYLLLPEVLAHPQGPKRWSR
jgi:hypothetical protein